MIAWEKPEIIHLEFQKTMHNGTPFDGEDSVYTVTKDGMTYDQCDFGYFGSTPNS